MLKIQPVRSLYPTLGYRGAIFVKLKVRIRTIYFAPDDSGDGNASSVV